MAKNATTNSSRWRIYAAAGLLLVIAGAVYWLYPRDTATAAYKRLYYAVKSKNIDAIKAQLSKKSVDFGAMAAQRAGDPPEKMYANGFTATTFSDTLPEIRDERVKDNMAAVEVWNSKDKMWEDLPFIYEDGAWKLAVGDVFAGTYTKPARSRYELEREAANTAAGPAPLPANNPNTNVPVLPIIPSNANGNTNRSVPNKKK